MARRRAHRTMTPAEQQAAGASTRGRSAFDRPREARPYGESAAQSRPRTGQPVPQQDVYDAGRYRRMRQEREDNTPLRRARHEIEERIPARSGYGEQLSGHAHRRLDFDAHRALKYAKRTLIGVLVALLAFSVLITVRLGGGISLETRLSLTPALPGAPFYMLLVGTDKSADRVENNSTGGVYRTDSIILARVDPLAAKLTLVSIQRDTLVDLGGDYGQQKINAAYTYGGAPLLIKTVSKLANVPIAHYAEIDFDSFTSVVDDLGGIDVNVPIDIDDELAGVSLKAGPQTINGAQALGLCRARHAYDQYGAGDYYRTANERMVVGAMLKKALSGNPFLLLATLNAASASVSTDITGIELMLLGARFVGFDMSKSLYSGLEPTKSEYVGGTWYEKVDESAWQTMITRVGQGLPPYEDSSQDPTAGVAGVVGQ